MMIKKLAAWSFIPFSLYSLFCFSNGETPPSFNSAPYLGLIGGYGSTTWEGLVPAEENQNEAVNLSTPIKVTEGGGLWGLLVGYEFVKAFALEFNYMVYPKARVIFDPMSLFSFENDDLVKFTTKTDSVSLMAKVMLPIANTRFRLYSSIGAAGLHRRDMLVNHWRLSPTFGAGLNLGLSRHLMAELGGNYTAGYGESQLSPTETFFPFLYSITGRIAFRF